MTSFGISTRGLAHGGTPEIHPDDYTKKLNGKIIGMICYLNNIVKPKKLQKCSHYSAKTGMPLAFISDKGKAYYISAEKKPLKSVYKVLSDYLNTPVSVVATTSGRSGAHSIIIKTLQLEDKDLTK